MLVLSPHVTACRLPPYAAHSVVEGSAFKQAHLESRIRRYDAACQPGGTVPVDWALEDGCGRPACLGRFTEPLIGQEGLHGSGLPHVDSRLNPLIAVGAVPLTILARRRWAQLTAERSPTVTATDTTDVKARDVHRLAH